MRSCRLRYNSVGCIIKGWYFAVWLLGVAQAPFFKEQRFYLMLRSSESMLFTQRRMVFVQKKGIDLFHHLSCRRKIEILNQANHFLHAESVTTEIYEVFEWFQPRKKGPFCVSGWKVDLWPICVWGGSVLQRTTKKYCFFNEKVVPKSNYGPRCIWNAIFHTVFGRQFLYRCFGWSSTQCSPCEEI